MTFLATKIREQSLTCSKQFLIGFSYPFIITKIDFAEFQAGSRLNFDYFSCSEVVVNAPINVFIK